MVIKPEHLKKGDTVGIISPSFLVPDDFKKFFDIGIKTLEDFGLKVKIGSHALDRYYYNAGTREDRISDFNTMVEDPEIKMILMSMGGGSALRLVDGIDYKSIQKNPKIISGISDGTMLLNSIYAKANVVTYHGPDLIFTFGRPISPIIKDNILQTFFSGKVGQLKPNNNWFCEVSPETTYNGWRWLREGKATGVLVGGHISCLTQLTLSGYAPDYSDKILFLEGNRPVNALDREFTALYLSGVFGKIKGLIIGWFDNAHLKDPKQDRSISELLMDFTSKYNFPILEIGELGHNVENYVFPIGCQATIDSFNNILSIDEDTVV